MDLTEYKGTSLLKKDRDALKGIYNLHKSNLESGEEPVPFAGRDLELYLSRYYPNVDFKNKESRSEFILNHYKETGSGESGAGFVVKNNRVIGLNLSFFNLPNIPKLTNELDALLWVSFDTNKLEPKTKFEYLSKAENLELLDLSNAFSQDTIDLSETIGNLKSLKYLIIDTTPLEMFPESFGLLKNLRNLRAVSNKLRSLPDSLCDLKSLKNIDLNHNQITNLPNRIGDLYSLQWLSISNNKLETLPDSIGDLSHLKRLDLSNNHLSGLPDSIGKLNNLNYLNLAKNDLKSLPNTIKKLNSLERFDISGNQFKLFPECIANLKSLKFLIASDNHFSEFPEVIMQLLRFEKIKGIDLRQKEPIIKGLESADILFQRGIQVETSSLKKIDFGKFNLGLD